MVTQKSRLEAPPTIPLNIAWEGLPAAIEDAAAGMSADRGCQNQVADKGKILGPQSMQSFHRPATRISGTAVGSTPFLNA